MDEIEKVLREKPIVLPRYLFNYYQRLGITPEELIILIFVIDIGDKIVYSGVQYFAKKHVDLFNEISATQEGSLIRGFNFVIDENKEYTKVCEVEYGEIIVKQYNFLGELINTFKYKADN